MKELHIISVGKIKESRIVELEQEYCKRLPSHFLKIHEVKSFEENTILEAQAIEKKIEAIIGRSNSSNFDLILLSEHGKNRSTPEFADWLYNLLASPSGKIFLAIGGAAGLDKSLYHKSNQLLSLSPLTFPHKLARLILIEQIYRAYTIKNNHPYHK